MKAHKLLPFLVVVLSTWCSTSNAIHADYLNYFKATKRARLLALEKEYEASIRLLKTTFEQYDFEYARDCINAVEIAALDQNDSALHYFLICAMKRGVPFSFFDQHPKLSSFTHKVYWQKLSEQSDLLYNVYLKGIHAEIREEINGMFLQDQAIRKRYYKWYNFLLRPFIHRKWKELNTQQVERMMEITQEFGFPGEHLIGIDPIDLHPNISPTQFSAGAPIVIFIHHYSQPNVSYDSLLLKQLENGYLYNEHFATIRDFQVRFGKSKFPVEGTYALRHHREATMEVGVMERRKAIGLLQAEEMLRLGTSGIMSPFWTCLY